MSPAAPVKVSSIQANTPRPVKAFAATAADANNAKRAKVFIWAGMCGMRCVLGGWVVDIGRECTAIYTALAWPVEGSAFAVDFLREPGRTYIGRRHHGPTIREQGAGQRAAIMGRRPCVGL
jgi:hypothetical protein